VKGSTTILLHDLHPIHDLRQSLRDYPRVHPRTLQSVRGRVRDRVRDRVHGCIPRGMNGNGDARGGSVERASRASCDGEQARERARGGERVPPCVARARGT